MPSLRGAQPGSGVVPRSEGVPPSIDSRKDHENAKRGCVSGTVFGTRLQ